MLRRFTLLFIIGVLIFAVYANAALTPLVPVAAVETENSGPAVE